MDYKKYQHIEKLGSGEVGGILNGTCYLSYKIDGTNGVIWQSDNSLHFGSRNRELTLDNDNANFMKMILEDAELMRKLKLAFNHFGNVYIYGEWLVPHTLKTYGSDAWKKFYIFDIQREDGSYVTFDEYCPILAGLGLSFIPLIAKLENPTQNEIISYLDKTGEWLVTEGLGEGIVIKNYSFVNKYGRTTWAKVLTEDFKNKKTHNRSAMHEAKENDDIETLIVRRTMMPEHIHKEYAKLVEAKGDWSSKYIFELLGRVFNEWFRDNWEIILKKFKQPTINFKKLKSCSDTYVKEVLNI